LREQVSAVIAPLGLRLAPEKTRVVHIDEGFDFLGFHIRRMRKRGTNKHYVYTTPSRASVQKARNRVRERTYIPEGAGPVNPLFLVVIFLLAVLRLLVGAPK
jgi:RNA-directed DNA polymerase